MNSIPLRLRNASDKLAELEALLQEIAAEPPDGAEGSTREAARLMIEPLLRTRLDLHRLAVLYECVQAEKTHK